MELFDRIYVVHQLLAAARRPVPISRFLAELECTRSTFKRVKSRMVDYLNAPIEYDRQRNGYFYSLDGQRFELPGMWFTPSELYALLAAEQLFEQAEPGLFAKRLRPLETRIRQVIRDTGLDPDQLRQRIRLAPFAQRRREGKTLGAVTEALLSRKRLNYTYHSRSRDRTELRNVSPQRLVRYRDNWFLDGWCHGRRTLRTFALDRISECRVVAEACREVSPKTLEAELDASYGIFAGPPRHLAILRFTGFAARWVADEVWHVDQRGQWLVDGRYELELPYSDHRELLMDIQRFGPEAEVISPARLRRMIIERARATLAQYDESVGGPRDGPAGVLKE